MTSALQIVVRSVSGSEADHFATMLFENLA